MWRQDGVSHCLQDVVAPAMLPTIIKTTTHQKSHFLSGQIAAFLSWIYHKTQSYQMWLFTIWKSVLPAVKFLVRYLQLILAISQTQIDVVNKVDNTDVLMSSSLKVDAVKLKSESGKILIEMKKCFSWERVFLT